MQKTASSQQKSHIRSTSYQAFLIKECVLFEIAQNPYFKQSKSGLKKTRRARLLAHSLFLFFLTFILSSCARLRSTNPSIVIIAVEGLSHQLNPCAGGPLDARGSRSGFSLLCKEGVQFSHAFTVSSLAQPSLTSLLTATYPIAHGVRDNRGTAVLSATEETLAERAIARGWSTGMWTSSPHIKRSSRVHQGFEVFEEPNYQNLGRFYNRAESVLNQLLAWLEQKGPTLTLVHLSDLRFPYRAVKDAMGELRPRSLDSKLTELDESLFDFFSALQKKKLWQKSWVILVGTNGVNGTNRVPDEIQPKNLFAENVQVSLLVKSPKKSNDQEGGWRFDGHVSLVDLGLTLRHIVEGEASALNENSTGNHDEDFPRFSLKGLIEKNQGPPQKERNILIESGFTAWTEGKNIRYSIRRDEWLVLLDSPIKIYNGLTDRDEIQPTHFKDPMFLNLKKVITPLMKNRSIDLYKSPKSGIRKSDFGPGILQSLNPLLRLRSLTVDELIKLELSDEELSLFSTFLFLLGRLDLVTIALSSIEKKTYEESIILKGLLGNTLFLKTHSCWELLDKKVKAATSNCKDRRFIETIGEIHKGKLTEKSYFLQRDYYRSRLFELADFYHYGSWIGFNYGGKRLQLADALFALKQSRAYRNSLLKEIEKDLNKL